MKIEIKKKNLFEIDDKKYKLVHCIAADARMGAGIAVQFVKKYPRLKVLRNYNLKVGQCWWVDSVLNLITKKISTGKPTYLSLEKSLMALKERCILSDIKFLAMSKIGCGLDRLQWGEVLNLINKIFSDTDIEIIVCFL